LVAIIPPMVVKNKNSPMGVKMATPGNQDIFEVLILLLKVLPNGAELIKDDHFMEGL